MLFRMTYNCDPQSLGDVSQEDFAYYLRQVMGQAHPGCVLLVTFEQGASRVTAVTASQVFQYTDPTKYNEEMARETLTQNASMV